MQKNKAAEATIEDMVKIEMLRDTVLRVGVGNKFINGLPAILDQCRNLLKDREYRELIEFKYNITNKLEYLYDVVGDHVKFMKIDAESAAKSNDPYCEFMVIGLQYLAKRYEMIRLLSELAEVARSYEDASN